MDRIACVECRKCNIKGKPSVTRLSKYCDEHYTYRVQVKKRFGLFMDIKNKFLDKRFDDKKKKLNKKGFRESWFWR